MIGIEEIETKSIELNMIKIKTTPLMLDLLRELESVLVVKYG